MAENKTLQLTDLLGTLFYLLLIAKIISSAYYNWTLGSMASLADHKDRIVEILNSTCSTDQ